MKQFFKVEITATKNTDVYAAAELTLSYKDFRSMHTVWLEDEYFDTDDNNFTTNVYLSAVPTKAQYNNPNFDNLIQMSLDELFLNYILNHTNSSFYKRSNPWYQRVWTFFWIFAWDEKGN